MKKELSFEKRFQALFDDCTPVEIGLIAERLVLIAEITKEEIKKNPKDYDSPIVSYRAWDKLCDKIISHMNFED